MAKTITVDIEKDGRMTTELDGFPGDSCYGEASKLREVLATFGLNVEVTHTTPKEREELEPRKVGQQQKASAG